MIATLIYEDGSYSGNPGWFVRLMWPDSDSETGGEDIVLDQTEYERESDAMREAQEILTRRGIEVAHWEHAELGDAYDAVLA